jgi:hypothetical protein
VFCGGVEETILVQMNIIECIFIYECLPWRYFCVERFKFLFFNSVLIFFFASQ